MSLLFLFLAFASWRVAYSESIFNGMIILAVLQYRLPLLRASEVNLFLVMLWPLGYNTWTKIYDCHICCTDHCDCNGNQLNWSHCHSQSEVGHVNKRLICSLLFRCNPVGVPQHEMRNAWSVCYRCASAMIQKSDFKWSWKVPCRQRIEEYSCRPLISRTQWRLDATEKLKV